MISRRGMTLIEMLVAMVVFSLVLGSALAVFRSQSRGFSLGAERMGVLQNARYAVGMFENDLRTAGSGVPDAQPFIIYADRDVIAFNANYTSNVANDVFAVYHDPDAPSGTVSALPRAQRMTIPNTTFGYPDTTYVDSPAETIVFYFTPDDETARTDDFLLMRKVNAAEAEVVSRNLLQSEGRPFLDLMREATSSGGSVLEPVPADQLPLRHDAPIHGGIGDTLAVTPSTGPSAIDMLRGVRIHIAATNGLSGEDEHIRAISRLVRIPNAGIVNRPTCGDRPLAVASLTAVAGFDASGDPVVTLRWPQAVDEGGGEKDVVRYVLWRRSPADPAWGASYLSIPSGNATYVYDDTDVASGDQWAYRVAAQDCTPTMSNMAESATVVVP
jgi:prepilin-type N-terminal cleavage/methylation domain-containing protein